MKDIKDIQLTDDSLTNIKIMIPYLNETGRAAVSALMFGIALGENSNSTEIKGEEENQRILGTK